MRKLAKKHDEEYKSAAAAALKKANVRVIHAGFTNGELWTANMPVHIQDVLGAEDDGLTQLDEDINMGEFFKYQNYRKANKR